MRPGAGLITSGSTAAATATPPSPPLPAHSVVPRSAWHSPVPYLFGGLAAMLGLIDFALLILACSYWKLSGNLGSGDDTEVAAGGNGTTSAGAGGDPLRPPRLCEDSIVVIMSGDCEPTFLATPIARWAASVAAASFADPGDATAMESKKIDSTVKPPRPDATAGQSEDDLVYRRQTEG